jgi:hypothetical protein
MMSRLLRDFDPSVTANLLRVNFLDDNLDLPRAMPYVTYTTFRSALDALQILERTYNVLSWSASQLRQSSCWYYWEEKGRMTRAQIIQNLGSFEQIYIPAKKAARIGQAFSSSVAIEFDQVPILSDNVKDIVSKTRPEKMFSDGIGKISQSVMDEI